MPDTCPRDLTGSGRTPPDSRWPARRIDIARHWHAQHRAGA